MKHCRFFLIIGVLLCCTMLSACQEKKKDVKQEVKQFVDQIEGASKKTELEKMQKPVEVVHVTYNGSDGRDPFELPAMVKNVKQYPNSILRDMSLDSLRLVGVVLHKDERWAVVRTSDGKVYKLTEGMRVGLQQALLTQITSDEVRFSVDGTTADEGRREVVMTMQESAQ